MQRPNTAYSRRQPQPEEQDMFQGQMQSINEPRPKTVQKRAGGPQQAPIVPPPPAMMQPFQPLPQPSMRQMITPAVAPPGAGASPAPGGMDLMTLLQQVLNGQPQRF